MKLDLKNVLRRLFWTSDTSTYLDQSLKGRLSFTYDAPANLTCFWLKNIPTRVP